jgi:hypothetical protein
MSRFRHDMKLALLERARRAPVVIDLDPSEWEEVREPASGAGVRRTVQAAAGFWMAATILLLAGVAAPLVDAMAHHAL